MILRLKFSFFAKILILLFWIILIFSFLFFPVVTNYLYDDPSLKIFTWSDMIDMEKISQFEKQTGLKIKLSFYESNEELFSKLRVTRSQDYDIIMVTDSGVDALLNRPSLKGLIKKVEKDKLKFWPNIFPLLLNHFFDPGNEYSIPYYWDVYGIGYNKKMLGEDPNNSWSILFDPKKIVNKIAMIDEALDAILISAQYLFGSINNLTPDKLALITKLLIEQKEYVQAYTNLQANYYLISGGCSAGVAQSAYVAMAMENNKNIGFLIPKEGSFIVIDSIVISSETKKDDAIYSFINFLYKEENVKSFVQKNKYLPVIENVLKNLDLSYMGQNILDETFFKNFSFFKRNLSIDQICALWIDVKSY